MKDMAGAAQRLADKGRYGDTMLVHMNPIEVALMDRATPGGLTTNPDTGQPEAFAFLLPMIASLAGPSLMSAMGLTGIKALLGTAALSGVADYAVNKDPGRALGSALLGFGMGGLGNAMNAGKTAAQTVAQGASAGSQVAAQGAAAANAARGAVSGGMDLARAAQAANPALRGAVEGAAQATAQGGGGLMAALRNPVGALKVATSNPLTVGLPLAAGASMAMAPAMPEMAAPKDDRYSGDYARERLPGERQRNTLPQNMLRYGIDGGEFEFFTPNNDRRAAPPSLGAAGLGAYSNAPGFSGTTLPSYSGGITPRNAPLRRYAQGGKVEGYGDGMSDAVPILASVDEYVVPADAVSALGRGSSKAGAAVLDRLVAQARDIAMQSMATRPAPV